MSLSTKVLFFCFSSLLLLPCQKTLVFRFFSINSQVILKNSRPLASNFSILLSNLLKKISIQEFYDTETTTARRKQKNKTLVDRKQLFLLMIIFFSSTDSIIYSSDIRTLVRFMYIQMGSPEAFHICSVTFSNFFLGAIMFWSDYGN